MRVRRAPGRPPKVPWGRMLTPFAIGVLLNIGASYGALRTFREMWFRDWGPGASPPWYFIGQDLVAGAWATIGLLVLFAFTLVAARLLGSVAWWAFAVSLIPMVADIVVGAYALLHSDHVLTQSRATTTWPTFEAYMRARDVAMYLSVAVAITVGGCTTLWYRRALKREARHAGARPPLAERNGAAREERSQ